MKKNRNEIIEYINNLDNYQGYIQFSNRKIDTEKDIFIKNSPKIVDEDGFIYEAYFCNTIKSIAIKAINGYWLVSETDIPKDIDKNDISEYIAIDNHKVQMIQIWENIEDKFCENMKVKKLSKVIFTGFLK